MSRDGRPFQQWRATGDGEIEVESAIGSHDFEIHTGWRGADASAASSSAARSKTRRGPESINLLSGTIELVRAVRGFGSGAAGCPCCA